MVTSRKKDASGKRESVSDLRARECADVVMDPTYLNGSRRCAEIVGRSGYAGSMFLSSSLLAIPRPVSSQACWRQCPTNIIESEQEGETSSWGAVCPLHVWVRVVMGEHEGALQTDDDSPNSCTCR